MKKFRQVLLVVVFCLLGCSVIIPTNKAEAATIKITKVSITNVTNNSRTMVKGSSMTLKTSISPTKATYKKLKWTSSKPSVVYVNQSGKVTAKKKGTAVITATARDGSKKKASVTITVGTMVSKVNVKTAAGKKLFVGKSFQLSTAVTPSTASNKKLIYASSNSKVATVSSKGVVKAVGVPSGKKSATATITVKAADGSGKNAKYKVSVYQQVKKIDAKSTSIALAPGTKASASCTPSPSNAYKPALTYKSTNTKVATVDKKGVITAKALGTAKITVTTTDGSNVKKDLTVKVVDTVAEITVPTTTQQLVVAETYTLSPKIAPAEISAMGVTYESSNKSILTVTDKGVVTAKAKGSAYITVTAKDAAATKKKVKFNVKEYSDIKYTANQFVGHMGSIYVAPSNSIPAYKATAESHKFMGIECDVRETKDHEFVLIHDADISARTNGKGSVSSLTLAEIQSATMNKGTNISTYTGLTIPTLKDYLYLCKAYGMKPVLHIKSISSFQKLVDLLNEVGIKDQTIITGGLVYMQKFKAIDSSLNIYWLCYLTDSNIETAAQNGFHMNVDYSSYVSQTRIEAAHKKGLIVGAWTVNNMNTAKKLLNKGIDFITTDMYDAIQ